MVSTRVLSAVLFLGLGACGMISDRSTEYVDAKQGGSLIIPGNLSDAEIQAYYPVPDISNRKALSKSYELPEPPDATAALNNDPFVIETVDGQTWLHLYTSPGRVWPLLDLFWSTHEVEPQYEDISKGFLHTEPLGDSKKHQSLIKALEGTSYQPLVIEGMSFQAKLVQGVRRNTAEIQVRAILPNRESQEASSWQSESINSKLELALLELIGKFVSSDEIENRYSLLANDIGGDSRVHLLKDAAGIGYLELRLSFQRAWSEIGEALKSAGVIVADYDRSQRTYYVAYLSEDEMTSWYDLSSNEEESKEHNMSLLLEVDEAGNILVRVKLLNPKLAPEKQNELLNIVFEHIS